MVLWHQMFRLYAFHSHSEPKTTVHNSITVIFCRTLFQLTTATQQEHSVEILGLYNTNLVGRFSPHLASVQPELGPD